MACWGAIIKRQSARKEKKKIFGDEGDLVMDGVLVVTDRTSPDYNVDARGVLVNFDGG